jgi:hypothetical protein
MAPGKLDPDTQSEKYRRAGVEGPDPSVQCDIGVDVALRSPFVSRPQEVHHMPGRERQVLLLMACRRKHERGDDAGRGAGVVDWPRCEIEKE